MKAGGSLLLLVLRRPRNDPSGTWSVGGGGIGGLASSPELSVGGDGAWTGPVASVGGGAFAVCVRFPMGRSVVPRINRRGQRRRGGLDVPPPPGIVLSGGDER